MPTLDPSDLVLETCTCDELPPWHHHKEVVPPCRPEEIEAKDGVNMWGRWHCLVAKGKIQRSKLIVPSQAYLDAERDEVEKEAAAVEKKASIRDKLVELKAKKKDGQKLNSQDVIDLIEAMVS